MHSIYAHRLLNQQIAATRFTRPEEIVAWLGAMQAQDYLGTLWAVGLRLPGSTETAVEQALNDRTIVRTWPMRGTLHLVAAADVRWMLDLLAPRRLAQSAGRRRQLDIDEATLARSREVCQEALQGGKQLARPAMFALLQSHGIATTGQRGIHILGHLAQEGLLCLGARAGKQFTFTLLDEWAPQARSPGTRRCLGRTRPPLLHEPWPRHGPGLRLVDGPDAGRRSPWVGGSRPAPRARADRRQNLLDGAAAADRDDPTSAVYLLPGFDEYMLGYQDRSAILAAEHAPRIHPGANGVLNATLVVDGRIQGVWRRTLKKKSVLVTISPFTRLGASRKEDAAVAAERYAGFLGLSLELEWQE